ncbi:hypothetical protein GE09DRAFT_459068 [Coniochaeta sp. 2T2.1]|nr:hypothetical protein GE09DRAFT_459068 [Coniochaeta sp. 2T2.1]
MSTPVKLSTAEQLKQLQQARAVVLKDPAYWSSVVAGILPIVGPHNDVELRRWGADFIAEAVATPAVPLRAREDVCMKTLGTLRMLLDEQGLDAVVLRSAILAAASVYPLVVRWIAGNAHDRDSWESIQAIKSRILRIWEGAPPPVRICCIKFAQRVVLAQTMSNGMDSKQSGLDVSLSIIPPNHPLLDPRQLEAEATGLLDRMLGILQDNSSDAILVDGTLNTLSVLVRTRPSTSARIVNTILNFNPLKLANSPMTPKTKVLLKSMEKTTRLLMFHLSKRDPHNPLAPRMQQYAERLMRSRQEIFEEAGRKRPMPGQPDGAQAAAKRQKMAEPQVVARIIVPPLGPGTHSLGALFTLTDNVALQGFDATQVPAALAARVSVTALASVPPEILAQAITGIQNRMMELATAPAVQAPPLNAETSPLDVEEDEDEYEPDFYAAEDTEQILNKLDNAPADVPPVQEPETVNALATLGTFKLPPPPLLNPDLANQISQVAVNRVFIPLATLDDTSRKHKSGINRLAASSFDRDSWLTVIIRIATRGTAGLEDANSSQVKEEESSSLVHKPNLSLSNSIRENLFRYVMEDFRRRIDVAVAWLCEEWYADQLAKKTQPESDRSLHYERWAVKLLDGFLPYLTPQDKVLTRFLAEIPELGRELLGRVKDLCRDPATVSLAVTSLLYLVMMRPPAREIALDTVGEIWVEYEDARPMASKYLTKWRPGFIESRTAGADMKSGVAPIAA